MLRFVIVMPVKYIFIVYHRFYGIGKYLDLDPTEREKGCGDTITTLSM